MHLVALRQCIADQLVCCLQWGGRFCDFMHIIDALVEENSLSVLTPIFVWCALRTQPHNSFHFVVWLQYLRQQSSDW